MITKPEILSLGKVGCGPVPYAICVCLGETGPSLWIARDIARASVQFAQFAPPRLLTFHIVLEFLL
jgi:hypothetical protein